MVIRFSTLLVLTLCFAIDLRADVSRWKRDCIQVGQVYLINRVEIDSDTQRMMIFEDRFSDSQCLHKLLHQMESFHYVMTDTQYDYKNIDEDAFEGFWAPNTQDVADDFNARKVCKRTDWRPGIHNEVIMTKCFSFTKTYQIIQIKDNELRFGTPPSITPEGRPTTLSTRKYIREP
jgi:hypothetical protein